MATDTGKATCHKTRVLIESRVVVEPGFGFGWNRMTAEERAKWLERWADELTVFFRDHRSMDVNSVSVEHEYQDQCSACRREWEEDMDEETGVTHCAWCGVPMEVVR